MNSSAEKLIDIVRESVHNIDPYDFLAGGAPRDEFDSQILALAGKVTRCESSDEVARAIAEVLNDSFSEDHAPSIYTKEASQLFARLQQEGMH
tara:strand:- start:91436 stop:91714 length:279 start_codon:yes stop_codon:yes gene_type:complete